MAMKINEFTGSNDAGRISIVACGGPSTMEPPYLQKFMKSLGHQ